MLGSNEAQQERQSRDLRKLDLNLLIVFETVYKTGSVSEAARVLGMTQPTVSNALARLRDHFSDQLFVRRDHSMKPTARARALLPPVKEALTALRRGLSLETDFDLITAARRFRLLLHDFSVPSVLPPIIKALDDAHSSCSVEVITPDWSRPHEALTNGDADIMLDISLHDQPGVTLEPLMDGEAVCVVREAHPTIGHALSPEQFAENGHAVVEKEMRLHLPTARLVMAGGLERRVVAVVPNAASLTVTIATTNLIAIVPRRYAELVAPIYRLRILPVPFEYPKTKIFLGWATERADDPGLQWLRGLIRATFAA
ncbi:LysR family transcriptional regulator [Qipengyuania sp. GH25]|uniref:LysR family transcriptional regulator n=1 Tax=Qipengyuania pacifica TaxID=2860199 RepID=A0ABS7JJ04_9SPHN|nr:LysR family transcriptional regulator [Qipengyuania aerophila]MBX7488718.1 LysR family transcriptional regulator [Qipengyuania aerophila]